MSQENLDAVRRMLAAVNAGDFAAAGRDVADDVVLTIANVPDGVAGEGVVGKDAFDRWFAEWFRTFERGYRFEFANERAEGDRVLVDVTHHARGRLSGVEVTMESSWVFEFRDGEIARCEGYGRSS